MTLLSKTGGFRAPDSAQESERIEVALCLKVRAFALLLSGFDMQSPPQIDGALVLKWA